MFSDGVIKGWQVAGVVVEVEVALVEEELLVEVAVLLEVVELVLLMVLVVVSGAPGMPMSPITTVAMLGTLLMRCVICVNMAP